MTLQRDSGVEKRSCGMLGDGECGQRTVSKTTASEIENKAEDEVYQLLLQDFQQGQSRQPLTAQNMKQEQNINSCSTLSTAGLTQSISTLDYESFSNLDDSQVSFVFIISHDDEKKMSAERCRAPPATEEAPHEAARPEQEQWSGDGQASARVVHSVSESQQEKSSEEATLDESQGLALQQLSQRPPTTYGAQPTRGLVRKRGIKIRPDEQPLPCPSETPQDEKRVPRLRSCLLQPTISEITFCSASSAYSAASGDVHSSCGSPVTPHSSNAHGSKRSRPRKKKSVQFGENEVFEQCIILVADQDDAVAREADFHRRRQARRRMRRAQAALGSAVKELRSNIRKVEAALKRQRRKHDVLRRQRSLSPPCRWGSSCTSDGSSLSSSSSSRGLRDKPVGPPPRRAREEEEAPSCEWPRKPLSSTPSPSFRSTTNADLAPRPPSRQLSQCVPRDPFSGAQQRNTVSTS